MTLEQATRRLDEATKKFHALLAEAGFPAESVISPKDGPRWRASRSLLFWQRAVRRLKREAAEREREQQRAALG